MLDLFRRKQRGLKFILWIVIIGLGLGMLLLFVDVGGRGGSDGLLPNQAVASVDGLEISAQQFRNTYSNFYDSYRRNYSSDSSGLDILKFLRIDKMALDKLIKDKIVDSEARRLDLQVSQEEIVEALRKIPGLNENGRFIGRARLERLLQANNSSLPEFEVSLVNELLTQKVRGVVSDGVEISEEDMRQDFLYGSQRATIEYVAFRPEDHGSEVTVVEAELPAFYEKTKERYRVEEQRRIKYLQVSPADFRSKVTVSDQDIRNAFEAEGDHTEIRARHILFKVEDPAKETEISSKAGAVLAEAKQGRDFAELARKNSQDPGSAANGGDLGFFRRGQMVQEFSDAAFAMEAGGVSELVRSQYGIHIIKVEEKRQAALEGRRAQLDFQLKGQKADELAQAKAEEAAAMLKVNRDIKKVSTDLGLEVRESGFFGSSGTIPLLGQVTGLQEEVFGMKQIGDVGMPHKSSLGFIVPQLIEKKEPFIPALSEVRSAVVDGYKKEKMESLAEARAKQFAASMKEGGDMSAAAIKVKNKSVVTAPFTRRGSIDELLKQPEEVLNLTFSMPIGKVSDALKIVNFYTVFRVLSRDSFDETGYLSEKAAIKERLETLKKNTLFQAYLENLDQRLRKEQKIKINQQLIDRIIGL